MLFNSIPFLFIFLPLTLLCYHWLGRWRSSAVSLAFLSLVSLLFYGYYAKRYIPLILGSILFNYIVGQRILVSSARRRWLTLGIAANVALLGYYKYAAFFIQNTNLILGSQYEPPVILLPLAISFFTFQQITYLVDIYRGDLRQQGILRYAVCVLFFPHLIAGPIVHYREMMPQFSSRTLFGIKIENIATGLSLFILGLFKKTVLADSLGEIATPIFWLADGGHAVSTYSAWIGMLSFGFQIYFDFSGYSDMALGLAKMFGIDLPYNFYSPYKAGSIIEFWRRWHITLSRFLKDYLYIPLGGNKHGKIMELRNVFITMFIGGLWHGAAWNFVIWGIIHGLALVINHAWRTIRPAQLESAAWYRVASYLCTLLVVMLAWVFFRAKTLEGASIILSQLFAWPGDFSLAFLSTSVTPLFIGVILLGLWTLPNTVDIFHHDKGLRWKLSIPWAIGLGLLGAYALIQIISASGKVEAFIYWKF